MARAIRHNVIIMQGEALFAACAGAFPVYAEGPATMSGRGPFVSCAFGIGMREGCRRRGANAGGVGQRPAGAVNGKGRMRVR